MQRLGKEPTPCPIHHPLSRRPARDLIQELWLVWTLVHLDLFETTSLPQSPDSQYREITSLLFSKRPGVTCWLKTPQSFPILSEGTCREMVMVYSLRVLLKHSMSGKNGINHPPPHTSDLILNANRE